MDKHLIGDYGELTALRYLRCHGYRIVTVNYRCKFGEIDIIAEDKKYICFIEVKTRSEKSLFSPADAVDFSKRNKIIASSNLFLKNYDMKRQPRFDIIEVYFENDEPSKLNHIEAAFDGTGN